MTEVCGCGVGVHLPHFPMNLISTSLNPHAPSSCTLQIHGDPSSEEGLDRIKNRLSCLVLGMGHSSHLPSSLTCISFCGRSTIPIPLTLGSLPCYSWALGRIQDRLSYVNLGWGHFFLCMQDHYRTFPSHSQIFVSLGLTNFAGLTLFSETPTPPQ